jgi:tetratricopeptide (TPR) repeat protein
LHVDVRILNANDRTALWSGAFDAPAQDAAALRLNAAAQSTALLRCAANATRGRSARLSNESLTLLLRGCAAMNIDGHMQEAHDALARVAERESGLAYARGLLAVASVEMSYAAPDTQREQFRGEARMQAERARRADPKVGESYLALERLEARDAWAQREGLLREGLTNDGQNADLNADYAGLLLDVGRVGEALTHARRANALDPLPPLRSYPVAGAMLAAGDIEGARGITEQIARAWPNEPNLWALRFSTAFWGERYDEAEALLTAPTSRATTAAQRLCWRNGADAIRISDAHARRAGAQHAMACLRAGNLPGIQTLMLVASLGDRDQAFSLARELYIDQHRGGLDALFVPQTQSMRSDPRFMPLMNDLGLLRYWDLNNNWPDFCREPRLPYRCVAEARRLLRGH